MDFLSLLWGPGLVFIVIGIWLVRKIWKAARTERILEENRRADALGIDAETADTLKARAAIQRRARAEQDTAGCTPQHLGLILGALNDETTPVEVAARVELLWARSVGAHAVWCERRHAVPPATLARDRLRVALVQDGKLVERWTSGNE